jgi:hypothetical protein
MTPIFLRISCLFFIGVKLRISCLFLIGSRLRNEVEDFLPIFGEATPSGRGGLS